MSGTSGLPAAFGRYRPLEELGTGAMGKVYLAIDPLIDRRVAVKVINAQGLSEDDRAAFLERFRAEVRAAALCAHPAIVSVYDFADDGPLPYIVMELVPGRTLTALLRQPPAERAAVVPGLLASMIDVLSALHTAHAAGVVHRDIKPSNIMITPQGAVKITDFGIARLPSSSLTLVGDMIGTPGYMAPEQALGQTVDQRTDLFATAAVLYEILHGRPPFSAGTMAETLLRLTGPMPADLGTLAGTMMGGVLARGLAKDSAMRFGSAAEFAEALDRALAQEGSPPIDATRIMPPAARGSTSAFPRFGSSAGFPGAAMTMAPAAFTLPAPAQLRIIETLAFLVGPIAKVLVQKAAAKSTSAEDFVTRVCAHVAPAEAAALRRKLLALL
jgi:serine/threonine-protein kinase